MKDMYRSLLVILLLLLMPSPALAQAVLKSSNFTIDSVNFGTNFTLTSSQSNAPPQISSEGPTIAELTPTTATITWKTDTKSSSFVLYGATTIYGKETGSSVLTFDHSVKLFDLSPQTDYHFQVKSMDAFGQVTLSEDKKFTTPAEAVINSIKIIDISYTTALISWSTGLFTASEIDYGTDQNYGLTKVSNSRSFLTDHTVQLTDLKEGTNYHFQIKSTDEKGNVSTSSDELFTTFALPIFTSVDLKPDVNQAVVSWKTNVFTTGIMTYKSDRDTKEQSAGDITPANTHSLTLKNLFGATTYNYTIQATDEHGKKVDTGKRTFTTLADTTPPVMTDLKVAITRSGEDLVLTVTWKTDEPATSKVTYAPKTNLGNVTDLPISNNLVNEHLSVSTGLQPSTPYTLKASSADAYNNISEQTINFVTPGLNKSIFQLILDNIFKSFGPIIKLVGG